MSPLNNVNELPNITPQQGGNSSTHFERLSQLKLDKTASEIHETALPETVTISEIAHFPSTNDEDGYALPNIDNKELLFTPPVQNSVAPVQFVEPNQKLDLTPPPASPEVTPFVQPNISTPFESTFLPEAPVNNSNNLTEEIMPIIPTQQLSIVKPDVEKAVLPTPEVKVKKSEPILDGILTSNKQNGVVNGAQKLEEAALLLR